MTTTASTTTQTTAFRLSMPALLLHAEGFALFIAAMMIYAHLHFNGWALLVLFFTPDIFMIGYLKDARLGSVIYNIIHTQITPIVLGLLALALNEPLGIQLALIVLAHIGFDRTMGYGLKYPTVFKDTHLNRV